MGISVIEHILYAATCVLPALTRLYQRRMLPRWSSASVFLLCCAGVYALLIVRTQVVDLRLEAELYAFDLDGNGSFSESERTPEQIRAERAWASDTGRALAPYTNVVFAMLITGFLFVVVDAVRWWTAFTLHLLRRVRP